MRSLLLALLLMVAPVALAADGDGSGPARNETADYKVACFFLMDTATATGARDMFTKTPGDTDEWYFFVSEDTGVSAYSIDIENFFETDDDPTVICTLTETNSECRWIRATMGDLHKNLRANYISDTGTPTDVDVQVCFTRYVN